MSKMNQIAAVILSLSAGFATSAHAAGLSGTAADFGTTALVAAAHREIDLDTVKFVNVTDGETVRFKTKGKTFAWHFSVFPNLTNFDLSKISPDGIQVKPVHVYVAANPLYHG